MVSRFGWFRKTILNVIRETGEKPTAETRRTQRGRKPESGIAFRSSGALCL